METLRRRVKHGARQGEGGLGAAGSASDGRTSAWARGVCLGLLILAAVLSFVDRQIVSLLVGPIKRDLGLSDIDISLLQGLAFAIFFAVAALPFGVLADRINRRWLLASGIFVWSVMTALCGAARGFGELFLARMGVGVGEATLGPIAHSLIADLYRGRSLPVAMSVYGLGVAAGAAVATALGGQVADWAQAQSLSLDLLSGPVAGWRLTFPIVAAPGLIVAVAVLILVPRRFDRAGGAPDAAAATPTVSRRLARLALRPGALILAGITCATAASYAGLNWAPAFLQRHFDMSAAQAGLTLGGLIFAATLPGGLFWSAMAARLSSDSPGPAALKVLALSTAAAAPFALLGYLAQAFTPALIGMAGCAFMGAGLVGLGPAIVQAATPPWARGRMSALQLLVTNVFGITAGPLCVALLTDQAFHDEAQIGRGLAIVIAGFSLAAAGLLWAARHDYRALLGHTTASGDPT